jgi:hypothetical protein
MGLCDEDGQEGGRGAGFHPDLGRGRGGRDGENSEKFCRKRLAKRHTVLEFWTEA